MGKKIRYALKKCKTVLIIVLVLWILLSIVLLAPVAVSLVEATSESGLNFMDILLNCIGDIGTNLGKVLKAQYIGTFLKGELYLFIILFFCGIVGIIKTLPKHDYKDIEHGSSDWAEGEQYSVLNKNKGILLAEKHYLPVDKRGNVNVLVVGRFWFW